MLKSIFSLMLVVAVAGCATTESRVGGDQSTQNRFGAAIISPLSDLNIVQTAIPPVIQEALKNPYQTPTDRSCSVLAEQILKLDAALGPDVDAVLLKTEKTTAERSGEFIQDEAIGSVERTISGAIPFRGWIRKLTGADRHAREVHTAIAAGIVRRAFLKGIGQEHGCKPPAAPQILTVPQDPALQQIIPSTAVPASSTSTSTTSTPLLNPPAASTLP